MGLYVARERIDGATGCVAPGFYATRKGKEGTVVTRTGMGEPDGGGDPAMGVLIDGREGGPSGMRLHRRVGMVVQAQAKLRTVAGKGLNQLRRGQWTFRLKCKCITIL